MPAWTARAYRLGLSRLEQVPPLPQRTFIDFQGSNMNASGLVVSHAREGGFERGMRSFFEYRDLGINAATQGQVVAHVIRAVPGTEHVSTLHCHKVEFQFVFVLQGWVEFEYEGYGPVRLERGSSVYQPPGIHHREIAHSDDLEMLEIVMPAQFETEMVPAASA